MFIYQVISNKKAKKFIIISGLLFICFLATYTLVHSGFVQLDSVPIGVETLLILLYSSYYLFEQMNNAKVLFIYTLYPFWVILGFMLYLAGSFFIYIFANQIPYAEVVKYWFIVDIFIILKNLAFSIAILIFGKSTPKHSTPQPLPTSLKVTL